MVRTVIEIILALFAVFGLYSAIRLIIRKIFGSKNTLLAIEIKDSDDARGAEAMIREAMCNFLFVPSERVAVMISEELTSDTELMAIIDLYGVECYVIDS